MTKETDKTQLRLNQPSKLELKKTVEAVQIRQSFSHGRSKTVTVEVKRKRAIGTGNAGQPDPRKRETAPGRAVPRPQGGRDGQSRGGRGGEQRRDRGRSRGQSTPQDGLTQAERETRAKALGQARRIAEQKRLEAEAEARRRAAEEERRQVAEKEARRIAEQEAQRRRIEEEARAKLEAEEAARQQTKAEAAKQAEAEKAVPKPRAKANGAAATGAPDAKKPEQRSGTAPEEGVESELDELGGRIKRRKRDLPQPANQRTREAPRRRHGKLTIAQALDGESEEERQRSLASVRRQREKLKQMMEQRQGQMPGRVVREVVIPETISVQELANRMAERGGEVVKALMKMGIMATINQIIDADIAELVVEEFGHRVKRVSAADVELGLKSEVPDRDEDLQPRPPVVTVMGHVDHGKTSLLDALRSTDVVKGEAGSITQHIGAYQVELASGAKITFLDTPGHAAFSAMRARGANVTDIVVLVVAADDGIKEQTVEAINHARAAEVPIIVAINKIDKPGANPDRVRQELLNHDMVVEEMGGNILSVEVSALKKTGLDKLEEAVLLQSEILDLTANPKKSAECVVVESKVQKGRGSVATVLVTGGTLRRGDVFIAGSEWGRVRVLIDDRNKQLEAAGPSMPVEILGLQGTPTAGDTLLVVENENRAREVVEFRQQQEREKGLARQSRGTLEQMLSRIREGEAKSFPMVIKT
ncbi:MAG: translation initiation factor IF-2, partial [Rhodospirillales bacterium]|nr:translation initiation factor IF-2 [Rhodospirillales bacterium]